MGLHHHVETDSRHVVSGIHEQITSLLGLMESWVSNLGQQEKTSVCDWLKLEETLCSWQSLAEKVMQTENENTTEPNI